MDTYTLFCTKRNVEKKIINEEDDLDIVIKKAKQITGHFSKSSTNRKLLLETQEKLGAGTPLTLIQSVDVRWNSQYDMFQR